ncbi:hypothetical protein J3R83DRAFT_12559 [Lanmaoa asiatica]|nr:hypothetical protein J3R83DRAFT_12559 [Lanmaoa asiatica]
MSACLLTLTTRPRCSPLLLCWHLQLGHSANVLVKGKRLGERRGVFEFVPFGTSGHFRKAICRSCSGVFVEFILTGEEFEWGNVFNSASVIPLAQAEYDTDTSSKSARVHGDRSESPNPATPTQSHAPATILHVCATDERDDGCGVIRRECLRGWRTPEVSRRGASPYRVSHAFDRDRCGSSPGGIAVFFCESGRDRCNRGSTDRGGVVPLLSSDPDGFLHHPIPRRERPVSMQGMPLQVPLSRRSSLHHRTRETGRGCGDGAWMLEESSPERKAYELEDDEKEVRLDNDNERSEEADWRQFHVDWLETIR